VWLTLALLPMSLGAHLVALLVFLGYSSLTKSPPKPVPPEKRPVSLRRLDSRQWAANRGARAAQPLERPTPDPRGQVVDVAPGNNRRVEDAKYLATTDNAVAKETRAKEQVQKWSVATPKSSPTPEAMASAKGVMPSSSVPPPSGINLSESMLGRRLPVPSLLPSAVSGSNQPDQPQGPVGTEAGSQAQGKDTSEGGGAPNDALENVAEGDGTFLNTKEWRYASFFNRVKQAVSGKWDPNGRLRQKNRGLGAANRITVMHVALRPDGSMADLFVAQSSGVDELDAEAMAAFEKAAPFANPPAGLVQDGFIRFSFSFHVTDQGLAMPTPFRFR
jgi:TonB family protein